MFSKLKKILKSKRAIGSLMAAIKVVTVCVLGTTVLVGGVALAQDVIVPSTSSGVGNVAEYQGESGSSESGVTPVNVVADEIIYDDDLISLKSVYGNRLILFHRNNFQNKYGVTFAESEYTCQWFLDGNPVGENNLFYKDPNANPINSGSVIAVMVTTPEKIDVNGTMCDTFYATTIIE